MVEPDSRWLQLIEEAGRWGVQLSSTHGVDRERDELGLWVSRDEAEARRRLRYLLDVCPAPDGWKLTTEHTKSG
jgi:hypothetical protein